MGTVYFVAVIEAGQAPGYSVFFPDLAGCASAGDTVDEAARNAEEALALHLAGMVEDGGAHSHAPAGQ
jgi:predicted RNase H-like HicB family nuclease